MDPQLLQDWLPLLCAPSCSPTISRPLLTTNPHQVGRSLPVCVAHSGDSPRAVCPLHHSQTRRQARSVQGPAAKASGERGHLREAEHKGIAIPATQALAAVHGGTEPYDVVGFGHDSNTVLLSRHGAVSGLRQPVDAGSHRPRDSAGGGCAREVGNDVVPRAAGGAA